MKKLSAFYEKIILFLSSIPQVNKRNHDKYWGKLYDFILQDLSTNIDQSWENIYNHEFNYQEEINFIDNNISHKTTFKNYLKIQKNKILNNFKKITDHHDIDLILDLGSGWGRNSITLSKTYPSTKIIAGEFSTSGRKITQFLIKKYKLNIESIKFDWNNPENIISEINRKQPKAIIIFSNCSIEQIPILSPILFHECLKLNIKVFGIHNEPVKWQINSENKPFKENYNENFIRLLKTFESSKQIELNKFEEGYFGHSVSKVSKNCTLIQYNNLKYLE